MSYLQIESTNRTSPTSFSISKDELVNVMSQYKTKDLDALEQLGGLNGLEKALNTNLKKGLSSLEIDNIDQRKASLGENVLPQVPPQGFFSLWFDSLKDTTLIILMVSAVVSLLLGVTVGDASHDWIEGTAILCTVFIVSIVTAANNFFKDRQFRKLNEVKNDKSMRVMRDGVDTTIKISEIVVGDVVILTTGCQIPADGLLIHGEELCADESVMTGEPEPPHKDEEDPFLLSGTQVAQGIGTMLVLCVGQESEWGRTIAKLQEPEEQTPLQEKLDKTAGTIGKVGLTVAILVFILLTIYWIIDITKEPWRNSNLSGLADNLIIAVTIVVVAIPEGLPLAVTISLAYSVREMMNDQNLVRHLDACETMGGATNICSDKTGTLTENRMSVRKGWIGGVTFDKDGNQAFQISKGMEKLLFDGIAVNSTAQITTGDKGEVKYVGAPTECALLVLGQEQGHKYNEIRENYESVKFKTYPFSSEKKRMSTVVKTEQGFRIFTKGAAEMILELCTRYVSEQGEVADLTEDIRDELLDQIDEYADQALRNIALAYNDISEQEDWDEAPDSGLVFVGLVGILDPVRESVPDAVRKCQDAGIIVRMVTGDNLKTAIAIAKKCGILKEWGIAMEGPEFAKLSDDEIDDILPRLQVLARSSPTDKYTLVTRLRKNGEVVAVTGDGTNDAPALKASDVGLAMGIAGTEVAKEASDIIIMDDNFSSIAKAVLWGRSVYDNIRKFLAFQLTINITALAVAFVGAITRRGTPLTAVQLLWVNLIMDTFAALILATEKPANELMERKPYGRSSALLSPIMLRDMFIGALFQSCGLFTILYCGHILWDVGPENGPHHYSMLFNTFVLGQVFNLFNARKVAGEYNVFSGLHRNFFFPALVSVIVVGQILIVQFGYDFTSTRPLNSEEWLSCVVLASLVIPLGFITRLIPIPKTKEELAENPNFNEIELKVKTLYTEESKLTALDP